MLSCYELDVGISNTGLMRETDVGLTASFVQNALVGSICAGLVENQVAAEGLPARTEVDAHCCRSYAQST